MLNFDALERRKRPFVHWVGQLVGPEVVREINAEWPGDEVWHKEDGKGQRKWGTTQIPPAAQAVVDAADPAVIGALVGIEGLIGDPGLGGAGLHCIPRDGFLKMHVDFNRHPTHGWHRRVNVLLYLNEVWHDAWGGHLQLGIDHRQVQIAPLGGRCVVFETNDESWHGHPQPLACPDHVQRRSLAMYFYTPDPPKEPAHTTIYRK